MTAWMNEKTMPETAHDARHLAVRFMETAANLMPCDKDGEDDGSEGLERVERTERAQCLLMCAQVCATLAVSLQAAEDRKI